MFPQQPPALPAAAFEIGILARESSVAGASGKQTRDVSAYRAILMNRPEFRGNFKVLAAAKWVPMEQTVEGLKGPEAALTVLLDFLAVRLALAMEINMEQAGLHDEEGVLGAVEKEIRDSIKHASSSQPLSSGQPGSDPS